LSLTARTAVTIFFACELNLFLYVLLIPTRKAGGERRIVTFPSGALVGLGKTNLSLNMGLCGAATGVAPVRRRENAEGNRYSGVKVQVDDSSGRENPSRMPFDVPKGRQEGDSCFSGEKERKKESVWIRLFNLLTFKVNKR
jgi:hypothetical protein